MEVIVRQSRADKLIEISTEEVRARQRQQLSGEEARALKLLVRDARKAGTRERRSIGLVRSVLEAAFRHVYETNSVVREGEVLNAALELYPDFTRWRELREALESHPESIRRNGQITLSKIRKEEQATVDRVREGRNRRFSRGDLMYLPAGLTPRQAAAAETLLGSTDFLSVLVGDAGTGKTTVLTAIEQAHRRRRAMFPHHPADPLIHFR